MDKKIKDYKNYIEDKIVNVKKSSDLNFLIQTHSSTMNNFQAERIAHLVVTMFFALFTLIFITIFLLTEILILLAPCLLTSLMLLMYISHYYKLENSIQSLIDVEKKMYEKKVILDTNYENSQ